MGSPRPLLPGARRFGVLLHKCVQDHRVLLGLGPLLAALVAWVAAHVYELPLDWTAGRGSVLTLLWLLFTVVLAAEVGSRPYLDGSAASLGALPASWALGWLPRLVFLLLASGLQLGVLVALGHAIDAPPSDRAHLGGPDPAQLGLGVLGLGLAVFAAADLLRRPVPGILLGLSGVVGVPWILWRARLQGPLAPVARVLECVDLVREDLGAYLAGLLVVVAWIASGPWRRRGPRQVGLAAGVTLLAVAVPGVVGARVLHRQASLDPFGKDVTRFSPFASPDGRWIALEVRRTIGWTRQHETYWIDRDTGRRERVEPPWLHPDHGGGPRESARGWTRDGLLRLTGQDPRGGGRVWVLRDPLEGPESDVALRSGSDPRRWYERARTHLTWTATGQRVEGDPVVPSAVEGLAFAVRESRLWRVDLRSGTEAEVPLPCAPKAVCPSPNGERLIVDPVQRDRPEVLVDARDGRVLLERDGLQWHPSPDVLAWCTDGWFDREGELHALPVGFDRVFGDDHFLAWRDLDTSELVHRVTGEVTPLLPGPLEDAGPGAR